MARDSPGHEMKEKRGVAVIMAMWLLAVLAIIGTTFAFMMRIEPIIARHHRDDVKAFYLAQAGVDYALCILKKDVQDDPSSDLTYDTFKDKWAAGLIYDEIDNDGDVRIDETGEGCNWGIYDSEGAYSPQEVFIRDQIDNDSDVPPEIDEQGEGLYMALGAGSFSVTISDLSGRVNINNWRYDDTSITVRDSRETSYSDYTTTPWRNLLDGLKGVGTSGANNIASYRAGADTTLGTSDDNCYDFEEEIKCANSGFEYDTNKEAITAFLGNLYNEPGDKLPININTANPKALRAWIGYQSSQPYPIIGVTDTNQKRFVEAILSYRAGADGIPGTTDDNPFDGVDDNSSDAVGPGSGNFPETNGDGTIDWKDEFNALIDYMRSNSTGYPTNANGNVYTALGDTEGQLTEDYVRDNIKDNADITSGYDHDGYDSNTTVPGYQDNHYQCPNCKAVVCKPVAPSTTTTCPVCGSITPKRIYKEIDRDGKYEPGLCPDHDGCSMGGKVMSRDSTVCPICGATVTPTAYSPSDFSADPETYTTHLVGNFSNKPPKTSNDYFEIISTGMVIDSAGRAVATKKIRAVVDRGAKGAETRIKFWEIIPED